MDHKLPSIMGMLVILTVSCLSQVRPPAVPLVTHDPYFSIWSMDDQLSDGPTRHWSGNPQRLTGLLQVDGQTFRWMGSQPHAVPAFHQTNLQLSATRTTYEFDGAGVKLRVSFLSPLLPDDLDVMSRPVTYITLRTASADGKTHRVRLLIDVADELAVDTSTQEVIWSRSRLEGMTVLRASNFNQPVLQKSGDDVRVDWGSVILAVPDQPGVNAVTQAGDRVESTFASGVPGDADDIDMPRRASERPVLAAIFDLGEIGGADVLRHVLLGYDDLYSIEYLNRWMRPYWRRNGITIGELLKKAERDYVQLDERSRRFDEELQSDLKEVGGPSYAELATLAFRQTIAAHKLVADIDGQPLFFPKENFSNGCIATTDVIYPSSPFFLLFNPGLLKAQLLPLMEYAKTGRWHFAFAPHDLGTYPKANGQVYGGGERTEEDQMPVEESGNMLLMFTALARAEGNGNFADHYWSELQGWAAYLREKGMDPSKQLSTDDFAGHLEHNANLSIKAILALAGYASLADMTGRHAEAAAYHTLAVSMAKEWIELAREGDHFRLAFDKPETWSQKYNLVWDKILDLNVFSDDVAQTEIHFYEKHINKFGLPLDSRKAYTKLDWEVWTATLTTSHREFVDLVSPLQYFINHSPDRVPLSDWYWTTDGKQAGFQARSVVGGIYIPMLKDRRTWKKWRGRVVTSTE